MFVYKITHKDSGKVYIGKASNIKRRWSQHRGCGKNSSKFLSAAMKKYGANAFTFEVIASFETDDEAFAEEARVIAELDSTNQEKGYNLSTGGRGGASGIPKSPEHKAKIGNAHRGRKFSPERVAKMRLAPQSAEKRAKISRAHRGKKRKPMSPEALAKIAAANRGRKHSDEAKAKMRAYRLGKKWSEEDRKKMSEERTGRARKPYSAQALANMAAAGVAKRGRKLSPEHIEKLRGRKPTKEHLENQSEAQKRSPKTAAQIAKLAEINRGKKRTPEQCKAISDRLRGRKFSDEHRAAMSVSMTGKKRKPWTEERRAKFEAKKMASKKAKECRPMIQCELLFLTSPRSLKAWSRGYTPIAKI